MTCTTTPWAPCWPWPADPNHTPKARTLKRIYIAGPMTGLPDFNYPAFHAKAAELRAAGWAVENPAENPVPECGTWLGYMRMALRQLALCDAIYMLPGSERSRGAGIELRLAISLGLEVLREHAGGTENVSEAMERAAASTSGCATATKAAPPGPAARQFQDRDGGWHDFIDERHFRNTVGNYPTGSPRVSMLDRKYAKYVNRSHREETMNNKYPPLPEPLYERGDAPSMGEVSTDCYSADQMHAYAEATREGWLSPEDAKRLRGALEALADYVDEHTDDNECRPLENARTTLAAIDAARATGRVPPKRQDDVSLDFDDDFDEDLWDERDE